MAADRKCTILFTRFEWDDAKAVENRRKHGVSFEEASGIFADPLLLDDRLDYGEERWVAAGRVEDKPLVVSYTERLGVCRIISARPATARERRLYGDCAV